MLIILEVILTIFAWRRGWKWKALLPIGICVALGVIIGVLVTTSGGTSIPGAVVIFDLVAIIVLFVMCVNKPASKPTSSLKA